ncbi:zinc finger CCCH domain-containing protein 3 [Sabethes cyaneus]|uniref:zinc finger CCCH domain-containing protein 3 n=1 Tax=Sabethes cyaneus TaxID=53552 RepID=UPI00237D4B42|nr:zinc finger CCCH domain-containing protein 3 [Sabethes cyaneus]
MDNTDIQPSKIFINPDFKKAHINRNFLAKAIQPPLQPVPTVLNNSFLVHHAPNIHFNPVFIENFQKQQQLANDLIFRETTLTATSSSLNPIIQKTRRKLVRASSNVIVQPREPILAPLVKIGKNKLVRSTPAAVPNIVPLKTPETNVRKRFKLVNKHSSGSSSASAGIKPKNLVRSHSLFSSPSFEPQNVIVTDRRLLKLEVALYSQKTVEFCYNFPYIHRRRVKSPANASAGRPASYTSPNKKLAMVNINGLLYRSSTNKLQVSNNATPQNITTTATNKERCLKIRGTTFLLDPSGNKLRKVPSISDQGPSSETKLGRIDIGRLTYMPKTDGTFVKTDVHRTRSHLSVAKQRSIQVLTNKLRKCNVPCEIYQRLGKCTAFANRRCPKVHDPKLVTICSKFLRGECSSPDCLLSHNVSLEKMPVCHFFLEGRCDRNECPYLHKKVSGKERVCEDFLKGFCPLAEKCQRRHVFACPQYDFLGVCNKAKCPYQHGRKSKQAPAMRSQDAATNRSPIESSVIRQETRIRRYYLDNPDGSRAADGERLSAAGQAQRKRVLGEVEKMKQGHRGEGFPAGHLVSKNEEEIEINSDSESEDDAATSTIARRVKLGPLPSYIPL